MPEGRVELGLSSDDEGAVLSNESNDVGIVYESDVILFDIVAASRR